MQLRHVMRRFGVRLVPGMELTTEGRRDMHSFPACMRPLNRYEHIYEYSRRPHDEKGHDERASAADDAHAESPTEREEPGCMRV